MLQRLADAWLVKGKTVGIDAARRQASTALRSIVRRDTGEPPGLPGETPPAAKSDKRPQQDGDGSFPVEASGSAGGESTFHLIARARAGDQDALERLFARHLKPLQRWASGRLPKWARDLADTADLVQDTLVQTFKKIAHFEPRDTG
jgi:hypothetical protein